MRFDVFPSPYGFTTFAAFARNSFDCASSNARRISSLTGRQLITLSACILPRCRLPMLMVGIPEHADRATQRAHISLHTQGTDNTTILIRLCKYVQCLIDALPAHIGIGLCNEEIHVFPLADGR